MGKTMRILLVEDHADLARMISEHLARGGLAVDVAATGAEALDAAGIVPYDAMVLDLGLPDADGIDLLAATKRSGRCRNLPVLILTARDGLEDRIKGLNSGADDYLVKPFDLQELEARLRAILRRPGARQNTVIAFGDLSLDATAFHAEANGTRLDLSKKEFELLGELIRAAPAIVIKDMLEDRLYAFHEPVTPNAIEAIVSRLRKKIAATEAGVRIDTVRGLGYRIVAGAGCERD